MKLFGKALFEKSKTIRLYDFAKHGLLRTSSDGYGMEYLTISEAVSLGTATKKKTAEKPKPTPKELFKLGTLTIPEMEINCSKEYIAEQQAILKGKLELIPEPPKKRKRKGEGLPIFDEPAAVRYGRQELISMHERLGAREHLALNRVKDVVDEFPHTTNDKIRELLANQKHLEAKQAYDTLPDLPGEAVKAMKSYTDMTKDVTGKLPVFYLIAEKKDTSHVTRRRDPILLAQSPFGFFWQILGAWDEEIKYLDEL